MKPYSGPTKLVIAFDIGTTFSGISYCILEPGQVPEVLGVTKFPGQPPVGGDAKVPSLLYYDKSGNVIAAGAEGLTDAVIEKAKQEEWTKAEWWKLHLRPKHLASTINKDNDLPLLPFGKSAVDVLTDFIKYLFHWARIYITERHPELTWSTIEHSIEYIFTHPNDWEDVQRVYRGAIERAGLVSSTAERPSLVHMLTEGEASLHFCIPILRAAERANPATPRAVVIIDAGGGTIDSSVFQVTNNPISCEEIAPAECRLQGSVFVTRRARTLLQKKLEGWEYSSRDEIEEYAHEFDQKTKLVIKSDEETVHIKVALSRYTSSKYNISSGKLKLTGNEATSLFKESLDAIVGAFELQQKAARTPITKVFLVGGFSGNGWLWSRLQSYFKGKKIDVRRPDNHFNKTVANGAVLSHVDRDNHLISPPVARATYGVACSLPVERNDNEHIQRNHKWELDPKGDSYVPWCFKPSLRKGDPVRMEMEFRYPFSLTKSNPAGFGIQNVRILCYRGLLSDPKWVDQDRSSFSTYCTVRADLSIAAQDLVQKRTASGQVCYQLDYDVVVFLRSTELQAQLHWKTKDGEYRRVSEELAGVSSHSCLRTAIVECED